MEEKKFVMEFTLVELQTIINGLKSLPYEQVVVLINSIMEQHNKQLKTPESEEQKKE
jgi:hypothetical protein